MGRPRKELAPSHVHIGSTFLNWIPGFPVAGLGPNCILLKALEFLFSIV